MAATPDDESSIGFTNLSEIVSNQSILLEPYQSEIFPPSSVKDVTEAEISLLKNRSSSDAFEPKIAAQANEETGLGPFCPDNDVVIRMTCSERDVQEGMLKKAQCSLFDFFEAKVPVQEKQETLEKQLVSGKGVISKMELDFEDSYEGKLGEVEKEIEDINGEKIDGLKGNDDSTKYPLMIGVIDETVMIETISAGKCGFGGKDKGFAGGVEYSKRNVMKKKREGEKEKRAQRRGKGSKRLVETNVKQMENTSHVCEAQNICERRGGEARRGYSREEMEAMRFLNIEAQQKKWVEVYCGLGPAVVKEYDCLIGCDQRKHIQLNFDLRQRFSNKQKNPGVLGEDSQAIDNEPQNINPSDTDSNPNVRGHGDEGECSEEDGSDNDCNSILRPAFLVSGEPNFESGPPQDGMEYLRRVRWEAAQIPGVKVVKLERSKLNEEQTIYMPKIPDIAKCPEHLMPMKQWEDAFIADFLELRLALSRMDSSSASISPNTMFPSAAVQEGSSTGFSGNVMEDFDCMVSSGVESCGAPDKHSNNNSTIVGGSSIESSTLSVILKMDSVARLSMLRKRITSIESMSTMPKEDCVWLFALCAAIDTPLDADTCAALRCLLRKVASLRAGKMELDDEVIMLNILATVTGKYFGQSEY